MGCIGLAGPHRHESVLRWEGELLLKQSSKWRVKTGWDVRGKERLPFRAWRGASLRENKREIGGRTGEGRRREERRERRRREGKGEDGRGEGGWWWEKPAEQSPQHSPSEE